MTVSEFINKIGFKVNKQDVQAVNNTIQGIKSTATKVLGIIGIGFSLQQLRQTAEQYNQINDSINYTYRELEDTKVAQQQIMQAANNCKTSYEGMAGVVTNLTNLNRNMFPVEDASKFATVVQQLVIASGKSESEALSTQNLLARAFQSSIVDASTLTRLQRSAPALYEQIANQIGVSTEKLQQMAKSGELSSQQLKDAILGSADAAQAAFDKLDFSISDAMTNIRNQWGYFVDDMNSTLGLTQKIAKGMVKAFSSLMSFLNKAKDKVSAFAEKVGGMNNLLKIVGLAASGIAVAFNFDKISSGLKTVLSFVTKIHAKTLVIIGVIVLLALLVDDFINFLKGNNSLIGSMLDKAGVDTNAVRERFKEFWEQLKQVIQTVKDLGKEIGGKLLSTLGKLLTNVMEKLVELLPRIMRVLDPLANLIGNVLSTGLEILGDILGVIIELIGEVATAVIEILTDILPPIIELINELVPIIQDVIRKILPIIISLIKQLTPIITNIIRSILPVLINLVETLLPLIMQIIESILPPIISLLDTLVPIIAEFVDRLLPIIVELINAFLPLIAQIAEAILPVIVSLVEAVLPLITEIIEAILPVIIELLETLVPIFMDIIEAILPVIISLIEAVLPLITTIVEAILPVFVELLNAFMPLIQTIIETLLPPLIEILDSIMPLLEPIIDLVSMLVNILLPLIKPLLDAISPALEAIGKVLGPIFDILSPIVDLIATVIGWIADGLGWLIDLIFGSDETTESATAQADAAVAAQTPAHAKGTEYAEDAFVAGEEGPELITGHRGKKVFTAAATRNIAATLAALGLSRKPRASTVAGLTNISQDRSIVQNVEFHNAFNGDKAIQKYAAEAMDNSAQDVTAELARALAYAK